MRQLLSLLLALLAVTAMQANEPKVVGAFPEGFEEIGYAVEYDGSVFAMCYNIVNGTDVMFTILDYDLSVLKQFTIKNAYGEKKNSYDWTNKRPIGLSRNEYLNMYEAQSNCYASKYFFNTDSKWEVIICEEYNKKYSVYNEDGEFVCEAPTYYDEDERETEVMGYFHNNEDDWYFFNPATGQFLSYTQNGGNYVTELPSAASKAYPNPLKHGDTLTIEMENGHDGTFKVEVVDMKGAQLYSADKEAKNGVIKMPSVRLHKGWNVYTVKDGDEIIEKGKILVK